MDSEITSTAMMKLLGIRKSVLAELVERGVIIKAKTDRYLVLPSAPNYCRHLREEAAARGGQEYREQATPRSEGGSAGPYRDG
jgi:hypothetical protein